MLTLIMLAVVSLLIVQYITSLPAVAPSTILSDCKFISIRGGFFRAKKRGNKESDSNSVLKETDRMYNNSINEGASINSNTTTCTASIMERDGDNSFNAIADTVKEVDTDNMNSMNSSLDASSNADESQSSAADKMDKDTGLVKKVWFGSRFMERFFERFLTLFFKDPDILRITSKIFSAVFWAYLLLSALGTFGFDTKPLLSLLSISGLTLGFASKDILTNTFAGIFIIFTRPFKRGQIITVNNFRGKVLSIDIRYCRLQSLKDKIEYLVPLSMVYGNAITIEKELL